MSQRPKYRMRAPSTGREVVIEDEAGKTYVDRETGETLEVVGLMLPLPPSVERKRLGWPGGVVSPESVSWSE